MKKVMWVARREFIATVATKGFVIGVLILPLTIAMLAVVMPRMMDEQAPRVEGTVAVVDPTGDVLPRLQHELSGEVLARRRLELDADLRESIEAKLPATTTGGAGGLALNEALRAAMGETPVLTLAAIDAQEVETWKSRLAPAEDGGGDLLAVVVVHADAVRADGGDFGAYDLYVPPKIDDRLQREIQSGLERALVEARILLSGLDPGQIAAITAVTGAATRVVTATGERDSHEALNMLIPAGFMALLLMSVMSTGSQLMTNTVEDKSSRVVELLLAAASPMELMTGKILAQMAVGLVMLGIYGGMGVATLASFAVLDLVDPSLVFYLLLFYILSYTMMAGMMGAIGAAVNDASEASSLLAPVMLVMMIPWLLWLPITRNPDGALAVALSFLPPVNLYAMLLRMASTSPPPWWQVWLGVLVAAAAALGALWFAAKVFRIGLLMHGKPPDLRTLIRWVRMA